MLRNRLRRKGARMLNIMLTGVGGQGTVLAAKVLAQAALEKGWHVRTAETIGMAQRGGSVVSHVRMGDQGEEVHSPLIAKGTADIIIAFEPAEGARMLPYLSPEGALVSATTAIQPVTAALSSDRAAVRSVRRCFGAAHHRSGRSHPQARRQPQGAQRRAPGERDRHGSHPADARRSAGRHRSLREARVRGG